MFSSFTLWWANISCSLVYYCWEYFHIIVIIPLAHNCKMQNEEKGSIIIFLLVRRVSIILKPNYQASKNVYQVLWLGRFRKLWLLKLQKYICTLLYALQSSFNAMHSNSVAFVYAETHIKLVTNEFISARTNCDDRRQSMHLFSVEDREQSQLDITLSIMQ